VTIQTNLYETFVRSISVLYAAKCWTVRKVDEQRIFTTEMGWLRKLAGISKRRKKKNEDIRTELNQTETLVQKTERGRLQWFGHVKRIRTIQITGKSTANQLEQGRVADRRKAG